LQFELEPARQAGLVYRKLAHIPISRQILRQVVHGDTRRHQVRISRAHLRGCARVVRLHLRPAFRHDQSEAGNLRRLTMDCQVKPVGEQALQHQGHVAVRPLRERRGDLGVDIPGIGIQPLRPSGDQLHVDLVGVRDELFQREVVHPVAAPVGVGVVIVVVHGGMNRRDLELDSSLRHGGLSQRQRTDHHR
jgi:hypothetical protein